MNKFHLSLTWLACFVLTNGCSELSQSIQPVQPVDRDAVARIREEGLNHSQVMQTLGYLSDVIGPRLTGSPSLKRANEWTEDQLSKYGLENAHLEAWGPFGRGWSVKRFSAEVIEPVEFPLIAYPKAWSPGFDQPLEAEVVYLDAKNPVELDAFAGKLEGRIVLLGDPPALKARFTPDATRYTDEELARMAFARGRGRGPTSAPELLQASRGPATNRNGPALTPAVAAQWNAQRLAFALKEKAAAVCTPGVTTAVPPNGDDGTVFVQSANVPGAGGGRGPTSRVWEANSPPNLPQIALSAEHFNRLCRMLQAGEKVKMAVNLQVQFHSDDPNVYNTIAEIPGTDLKDQIVMLGGHMDSWHTGTGATDNGAGVAAAMEAVRIIKSLNLKPRRTIRIALWTGEEEGLLGSAAYVAKHFGVAPARVGAATQPVIHITKGPEYERLSAYFNLDNGGGRIRGIYCQSNPAVAPIFREWLKPFNDLGATTITLNDTGSTDHISFDNVGLPGFQFIQDWLDYNTRTHHSNMDVFDRIQADDEKQAATILATFVYNAAMLEQRMPRKAGFQ